MADNDIRNDDATTELLERHQQAETSALEEELFRAYGIGQDSPETPERPQQQGPGAEAQRMGADTGVVGDIAKGATETPRAIAVGTRDAAQETIEMLDSVAEWADSKLPLGGLVVDGEGVRWMSSEEFEAQGFGGTPELPDPIADPESTSGKMVKSVAQFVTGFLGAGKIKMIKALQPTTRAGKVGKAATKGAIADVSVFDPHEERLSDLIQEFPALRNPVSDYLKADVDDTEAEGRLKNAIEGLGAGMVAEGLVKSLRVLRAARKAKAAQRGEADAEGLPAEPTTRREQMSSLGDPENPELIATRQVDEKLAAGAREGEATSPEDVAAAADAEGEVYINFARIDSSDDIHATIQQMADASRGSIDEVRRGKRTWEQTQLSAEQKNAWATLMNRRQGEAMNAEESVAARQLWVTSASKLRETARLASDSPNEANLFAFRKMLATHNAIQKEVIAARTETARSLNAWKIPAGENAEMARQMDELLEEFGGTKVNRELAKRVSALSENGMSRELEKFAEQSAWVKTKDAVAQVWINALLTNPTTHMVNAMSNFATAGQQIYERATAARLAQMLGDQESAQLGEATQMVFGAVEGMKDAFRTAARHRRLKFLPDDASAALSQRQKIEIQPGRLSAETWNISTKNPLGMAFNTVDAVTRTPGAALRTADEFFKSMGYRMEVRAQALRQANSEVRSGALKKKDVKKRIAEIVEDPPENIRLAAVDQALYNTFTKKPAAVLKKIGDGVHAAPILGRLILPFKNTPINIMTYVAERSPFAPLVREWRADIQAGGARRDVALARVATGSFTMLAAMDLYTNGRISGAGPKDSGAKANLRRQGWQPYSIKVGNNWYSYSRADPVGMTFGIAADTAEIIANAGGELDDNVEEAVIGATLSIAKNATSKTYMQGISEAFDSISDPDRYGERWFQQVSGSFVPAGVAMVARQVDPHLKQTQSMLDSIKSRTPFWGDDLPPYRDLWGRPVDFRSPHGKAWDVLSPIYASTEDPEPIDEEMQRLEYFPQMPSRKFQIDGVTIDLADNPAAYSRYVELAGNEIKSPAWGMGAKDFLNAVVENRHPMSQVYNIYSDGPDGGKADFIRKHMTEYRALAKDQLLEEFPEIRVEVESRRQIGGGKIDPRLLGGGR